MEARISDITWHSAIDRKRSSSICIRHGLVQFKVFHRLHFCRSRLARLYPKIDPTCSRCHQAPATLYHTYWSFPTLVPFWFSIFDNLSYICIKEIAPDPSVAIFRVAPEGLTLCNTQADTIAFSSLLARRFIIFNWKIGSPSSHAH